VTEIAIAIRARYIEENGRERPQELFGRLKAEKVGSLPPVLDRFPPVLLELELHIWIYFKQTERAGVKDFEKFCVQQALLTFFTAPASDAAWQSAFSHGHRREFGRPDVYGWFGLMRR
jgi:hypothetical protein